MAAAYIRVDCKRGRIRTFGGNRGDVRRKKEMYLKLTSEEFMNLHPHLNKEDYETLKITYIKKWR